MKVALVVSLRRGRITVFKVGRIFWLFLFTGGRRFRLFVVRISCRIIFNCTWLCVFIICLIFSFYYLCFIGFRVGIRVSIYIAICNSVIISIFVYILVFCFCGISIQNWIQQRVIRCTFLRILISSVTSNF